MPPAVAEHVDVYHIVLYSPAYYTACAVGGALSCGLTHTLLTPVDLVKCNKQANPQLFNHSTLAALRDIYTGRLEPVGFGSGIRGVFRGWGATLAGYSAQGALKFGLYEWSATSTHNQHSSALPRDRRSALVLVCDVSTAQDQASTDGAPG